MPNPFSIQPLGGFDVGGAAQGLGQAFQQGQAKKENEKLMQDAAGVFSSGTGVEKAEFMLKNPELRQSLMEMEGFKNEKTRMARVGGIRRFLSGEDKGKVIDDVSNIILSEGGDPSDIQSLRDVPDEVFRQTALDQLALLDPNASRAFHAGQEKDGKPIGAVSPKDFTVESLDQYEKSGNIGDLVRYRPKVVKIAGVDHQQDPITLEWKPVVDLTSENISSQAAAGAEIEADKQSRLDFSKQKSKWNSGKSKYKTRIASSKAAHKRLKNTGKLIKDSLNRWTTTYGASLKGLPGSEARKLEGLINSIKAHSAFSTLTDLKDSGGTLGAISAPELTLLEAKLGTLDQRGDIEELARVVDQIIDANQGAIDRLESAYADDDTRYRGGYDQSLSIGSPEPARDAVSQTAPQGAIDYLLENPQAADQFRDKYGYLPEGL